MIMILTMKTIFSNYGFIIKNNEIKLKDYFNKYFEKQFRCEIFFLQKGLLF